MKATNSAGTGSPSAVVSAEPAATATAPGAPRAVTATGAGGQLVVSWTAPASNGGAALDRYLVQHKPAADTGWSASVSVRPEARSRAVSGLTNGTYNVRVAAVNSAGTSDWSATASATLRAPLGRPQNVTAAAGDAQITLTWQPPTVGTVVGYRVRHRKTADADWSPTVDKTANERTHTFEDLDNAVGYTVAVAARDAGGLGEWATATATPCGLVHHWTLDETTGTTAADTAGDDDGTVTGATWTTAGKDGGALSFDGSGDGIQISADDLSPAGCGWTAALWVKRSGDNAESILFGPSANNGWRIKLEQWNNTHKVGYSKVGVGDFNFDFTTPLNTWTHLVLVGTGTDTKLYADGTLRGTLTRTLDLPLHSIGAQITTNTPLGSINADLDDIRVYAKALTATEVAALHTQLTATNSEPSFDDGAAASREVAEDAASGTGVGATLAVTDPDSGDTLTFTLAGSGSSNFAVAGSGGGAQITVAQGASLDHETTPSYTLVVSVTDNKAADGSVDPSVDDTITVTVTVTDANDDGAVTFDSSEPRQDAALTVTLADPDDSVGSLTWTWTRLENASDTTGTTLSGATSSGLASEYTPVAADVGKWLSAAVAYSDAHGANQSAQAVSGKVAAPAGPVPSFDEGAAASREVPEDAVAGTAVGDRVNATDSDAGDVLVFALSGAGAASFDLNTATGQITVAQGASLDHETTPSYTLTMSVTDNKAADGSVDPSVDDTITVTVTVTDVNEAGAVTFDSSEPQQGAALTATLADPDDSVGSLTWTWTRLENASDTTGTTLSGATSTALASTYTPIAADVGKWLRAAVAYSDTHGTNQSAQAVTTNATVQPNAMPDVIPRLREWSGGSGLLVLGSGARLVVQSADAGSFRNASSVSSDLLSERTLSQAAATIKEDLKVVSGLDLSVVTAVSPRAGDVFVELLDAVDSGLGAEGYELVVDDKVTIRANTAMGVFWGSRSLLQILAQADDNKSVPRGTARDFPSQQARMIAPDMGRKFWEVDYVRDSLRQMSWYKMNLFLMHISEPEAFRLYDPDEADSDYVGLADPEVSYSKADVEALDDLAQEYFVTIMPGFDFPGHASAVSHHFSIGSGDNLGGGTQCTQAHSHAWLTPDYAVDLIAATAINRVHHMIRKFAAWFDGPYVHVGADEVPHQLGNCDRYQRYISANADVGRFTDVEIKYANAMNTVVKALGKKTVMYGDVSAHNSALQSLDTDIVIHVWNTNRPAGYRVIHNTTNPTYLTPNYHNDLFPNEATLYDSWTPSATDLGSAIAIWADAISTGQDEYFERFLRRPRAIMADRTWNATTTPDSVTDFYDRINAIGTPPDFGGYQPPARVDDGQPSHHYEFTAEKWGDFFGHLIFPDTDRRRGMMTRDTVGGLHAWAGGQAKPEPDATDGIVGSSFLFVNGTPNKHGLGNYHQGRQKMDIGGVPIEAPWTLSVWVKRQGNTTNATLLTSREPRPNAVGLRHWHIRLQQGSQNRVGFTTPEGASHTFNFTAPLNTLDPPHPRRHRHRHQALHQRHTPRHRQRLHPPAAGRLHRRREPRQRQNRRTQNLRRSPHRHPSRRRARLLCAVGATGGVRASRRRAAGGALEAPRGRRQRVGLHSGAQRGHRQRLDRSLQGGGGPFPHHHRAHQRHRVPGEGHSAFGRRCGGALRGGVRCAVGHRGRAGCAAGGGAHPRRHATRGVMGRARQRRRRRGVGLHSGAQRGHRQQLDPGLQGGGGPFPHHRRAHQRHAP